MNSVKSIILTLIGLLILTSCNKDKYKFEIDTKPTKTFGENIDITIRTLGEKASKIELFIDNKKLNLNDGKSSINSKEVGVGKHLITILAFVKNRVIKNQTKITVFAKTKPKLLDYEIINEYPHDKKSYTQGLEFHEGQLYETTGRIGQSWLRKINYKTGEVLKQYDLKNYFGEGMTILNNSIYWLTWQGGRGFKFNKDTFEKEEAFYYNESTEGWGLTHNTENLIKSDGSSNIYFLNKKGKELNKIQAFTDKDAVDKLNELEYVDDKIYANRWITETPVKSIIVVINSNSGAVEGVINLNKLREKILEDQQLDSDEVLNGIAYNNKTKTFFVTGKHWGKLFEIKIID